MDEYFFEPPISNRGSGDNFGNYDSWLADEGDDSEVEYRSSWKEAEERAREMQRNALARQRKWEQEPELITS